MYLRCIEPRWIQLTRDRLQEVCLSGTQMEAALDLDLPLQVDPT